MKISIIADTHSYFDDQLARLLQDSDEIWHAGDIGSPLVLDELSSLAGKIRAVSGNIDGKEIRIRVPEYHLFQIDGLRVMIIHIAGKPPGYNLTVRKLIASHRPNMLICGHSHILKVVNDPRNRLLCVNPGACGNYGFHKIRTIINFEIIGGKPVNMNAIELGKRGQITT